MKLRIAFLALTTLMTASAPFPQEQPSSETRLVSERLMGPVPKSGLAKDTFVVSRDSRRFAYLDRTGSQWFAVVDGKRGKQYPEILKESLIISPDSQHVAYVTEIGNKQVMVVDGVEGTAYERVGWGWASAFLKHNPFGSFPVFSPDGKRVAYAAKIEKAWSVIVDGQQQKAYDEIGPLVFSADSNSLAYEARLGKEWFLVLNGRERNTLPYRGSTFLGYPVFSPDGKRLAYEIGYRPYGEAVVVDDREGEKFDGVDTESIVFSPDSRRIAYVARDVGKLFQGEKELVVLDGTKQAPYDSVVRPLRFSPDSQRFAYAAFSRGYGRLHLVVDGQVTDLDMERRRSAGSALVPEVGFSRDSKRVALFGDWPGYAFLLVDGKEVAERREERRVFQAVFSPDGQRLAYTYGKGSSWSVVVDGKEGSVYSAIGCLVFSPDGGHLAYVAGRGNRSTVVVDGREGNQYDDVIHVGEAGIGKVPGAGGIVFDAADALHYLAVKEGNIYLIEEKMK